MWDGVDRRKFLRADYPCLITMRKSTPPQEAILTHTEDISITGVRILAPKKLPMMAEIDLELDLKDTLPTVISRGMVKRVKEIAPSGQGKRVRYDIGIEFVGLSEVQRVRIKKIIERVKGG